MAKKDLNPKAPTSERVSVSALEEMLEVALALLDETAALAPDAAL